ncbi:class I SAM-dependent methyltransferase [Cellulomonas sp. ACRRI]|uniref:class I SAM-dependent methyltransferase n=1 Tax=Cellulomonas sp. ACRRI TaxID=2918188 RepID=UPI001EF1D247|nr:class I SAM-dependent methyltransferase [Cellulomonas sp. ACRRI]MCG7286594.1 class I SAM-dependent methyltransferase [Cellulomonas sp. ACRRI]
MTRDAVAVNRRSWDAVVPAHLLAYGADGFVADARRVTSVVRDDLAALAPHLPAGSPAGLDLAHLQCHIGLDTLSWARLGARVTGVDLSPASVAAARDLAERAGLAATFLESDVAHVLDVCPDRFDVVYTGIGALCWLPDLDAWARVVAGLLRPGGTFYVREAHPVLYALDPDRSDGALVLAQPYFGGAPRHRREASTYAGGAVPEDARDTYEWQHGLAEIVQALLGAGLRLAAIAEHRTIPWPALPGMVPTGDGSWALPDGADRLPLTFALTATKPT